MDIPGAGKSPNSGFSFRYNANNELLEELYSTDEVSKTLPSLTLSEGSSPKKVDKAPSLIDKYFKRDKTDKHDESKSESPKTNEDTVTNINKEATSSPVKEYLASRLGKKTTPAEAADGKEPPNETWKLFHDFKYRIAQAVEDIKLRSNDDEKNKSVVRDNSMSDSEENSIVKDSESVEDTDNQVSSLESSINNLSEVSQPVTAKANDEMSLPKERSHSESTDDTHKNLDSSESADITKDLDENLVDIESGVEALEETNIAHSSHVDGRPLSPPPHAAKDSKDPIDLSDIRVDHVEYKKKSFHFFSPILYVTTGLLLVTYFVCPGHQMWNGFILGIWVFSVTSSVKLFVKHKYLGFEDDVSYTSAYRDSYTAPRIYTIPSIKEYTTEKNYEGWINHYRYPEYFAETYNLNKTTTAFMKLEGTSLRISYTGAKVAKRAMWDERVPPNAFYQHRVYSLVGARVTLLPQGLVARRLWSKKYPICVMLREDERVQVLERDSAEAEPDTSTSSPVRRRKFVWRRRERPSTTAPAGEDTAAAAPPRDSLRHRFGKKTHKDKKAEAVSAEVREHDKVEEFLDAEEHAREDDEDLDDAQLRSLKEVLEEDPLNAAEEGGEWTAHVRRTKQRQCLFLFGRTGRDKHEWYRRLLSATHVPLPPSADASAADDKSEDKDKDTTDAVYRVSDRDSVSFSKPTSKPEPAEAPLPPDALAAHEQAFWPYFLRVVEAHCKYSGNSDVGSSCRPPPPPRGKRGSKRAKKKSLSEKDAEAPPQLIDSELLWLNAAIARFMYDFMNNDALLQRLQHKVQLKLNTIKLPSFMSPLLVTSLSLSGAPPLVECMGPARWDSGGLRVDARVRYAGGAAIAVLTQINLLKLKERSSLTLEEHTELSATNLHAHAHAPSDDQGYVQFLRERKPAIFDSDVEDSAESSSDDDSPPLQPIDSSDALPPDATSGASPGAEPSSSKKKFFRMVDKIATSKTFQTVTDYKYVKRAMEGLSNTDIKLHLEVCRLEGRLALQLPPPPHDRLWLGFHANPRLVLKARPAFGARSLRFAHITNWIEQKLAREFEKVIVLPNMEDIYIPAMTPTPVEFC